MNWSDVFKSNKSIEELVQTEVLPHTSINKPNEQEISSIPFEKKLFYIRDWIPDKNDQNGKRQETSFDKSELMISPLYIDLNEIISPEFISPGEVLNKTEKSSNKN
ncbi:hypothetical protein M0812_11509 [Anaeramoeba flamelloides]|uniref:Uncharacterized protein n=1 Tax=Anaeramoeba flamelloides TaxID=1746091 RepID=A0AAV7ZZ73_9EUKA|nr:hypothetical protein M0812_11509 [Anaeramoeba flamelloides]